MYKAAFTCRPHIRMELYSRANRIHVQTAFTFPSKPRYACLEDILLKGCKGK